MEVMKLVNCSSWARLPFPISVKPAQGSFGNVFKFNVLVTDKQTSAESPRGTSTHPALPARNPAKPNLRLLGWHGRAVSPSRERSPVSTFPSPASSSFINNLAPSRPPCQLSDSLPRRLRSQARPDSVSHPLNPQVTQPSSLSRFSRSHFSEPLLVGVQNRKENFHRDRRGSRSWGICGNCLKNDRGSRWRSGRGNL